MTECATAKLIRGEIFAQQYSMDTYPSTGDISDWTMSSKWVPPLLHQLLSGLVQDDVKCFEKCVCLHTFVYII